MEASEAERGYSRADVWCVQPAARFRLAEALEKGYSVSGYAVAGHIYTTKPPTRPSQPLSAEERRLWKEAAVEDAMRELGLSYGHRMRLKLKRRSLADVQSCLRKETGEIDRTVLRLCETGQLSSKVGLYRILDHNHSVDDKQFTLVTKQPVKQYEPICAVIGTLREHHAYRKLVGGSSAVAMLWAVIIDKSEMPPHYSGPELLVDTAHYSNESRFLRDPTFAHRDVQPNVEARLVWNQKEQSIYVVYVTLQAMPAGVELWKRWDVKSRELVWEYQMRYAARRSHCQWHLIGLMQKTLRDNGLDPRPTQLLTSKPRQDEHEETDEERKQRGGKQPLDGSRIAIDDVERKDEPQQPRVGESTSQSFPAATEAADEKRNEYIPFTWHESLSWTLHHACAHAVQEATTKENRRLRRQLHLIRQLQHDDSLTVPAWQAAGLAAEEEAARLPAYDFEYLADDSVAFEAAECERITQNDWSGVDDEARREVEAAYKKNAREANRLNGDVKAARASGRVSRAAIHRLISLHHPARLYAPPNQPSFALVATAAMRKEACVGAYVGKVYTAEEYNKSKHPYDCVYGYEVDCFDLELVIDSLQAGNALRFMNDCFARRAGRLTTNVSARFLFDAVSRRPNNFILVSAQAGVRKGEELVTDYGRKYWNRIVRALLKAHGRFGDQARLLIQALRQRIEEAGLPVPPEAEWRDVRAEEFREGWVDWPRFEGDEEASMDDWAQTADDDGGQQLDSHDSRQHTDPSTDDRAPAGTVTDAGTSSSSELQPGKQAGQNGKKRKRTEKKMSGKGPQLRKQRSAALPTNSGEQQPMEEEEELHAEEEEHEQVEDKSEPAGVAVVLEVEPSLRGAAVSVTPFKVTVFASSAGLREEIDLVSDEG